MKIPLLLEEIQHETLECTRCLYTSEHPFGLEFSEDGICSGCLTHREKYSLDWEHQFKTLEREFPKPGSSRISEPYDCIVPIRGTPEHFYVLDVLKNKLGVNPLMVVYNSQFNTSVGVRNIDRMREAFDVDSIIYSTDERVYRKLVRESLARLANLRWPFLAGESSFVVRMAIRFGISKIVWPYHQPTEQVGAHSYTEFPEMSRRDRVEFSIGGTSPNHLISSQTLLNARDLKDLQYPPLSKIREAGIRGLYLSNYLPWDTRTISESMVERYGALPAKSARTFDTYDRVDDGSYMGPHDLLKYGKLGYSRVRDSLCREVRFGRITRETAQELDRYYNRQWPDNSLQKFLRWLGMTEKGFLWMLNRTRFGATNSEPGQLGSEARAFVQSFFTGDDVDLEESYILLGKGLGLNEKYQPDL